MQPSRFSRVVAILVLFDTRADPREVVRQLTAEVGLVVVVDNSAHAHPVVGELCAMSGVKCLHNANRGGLAGAYNQAMRLLNAETLDWTHVVFVDDDSDPSVIDALLSDDTTSHALAQADTAAVSAVYRDRSTGLRGSYTQLQRFSFRYLPRDQSGLVPVAFLINSMSVWRRSALAAIGPFNEWLGVDRVDTDYCLRAQEIGLGIYINGDHEFAHSIGARQTYRLLGVTLQSSGHSAGRRYSIARNTTWIARRYTSRWPSLLPLSFLWIGYELAAVLLVEQHKTTKLWAIARGVWVGLSARVAPLETVER